MDPGVVRRATCKMRPATKGCAAATPTRTQGVERELGSAASIPGQTSRPALEQDLRGEPRWRGRDVTPGLVHVAAEGDRPIAFRLHTVTIETDRRAGRSRPAWSGRPQSLSPRSRPRP